MSVPYSNKKLTWFAATLAALATFIVYLPALQNGFVNWDDQVLVYENQTLRSIDIPFIGWALTDISAGLWHPMLWLSLALDYTAWGLNPFGYHLTNIIFHSVNTFLVFLLVITLIVRENKLDKKAVIAGTVASILFGIHPLHVESVVWVTERKDVLYSFFYLASILVYLKYASTSLKRYYLLSLIFFTLSLMSKPMAVSLPAVLLILDFYPLRRLTWGGGVKKIGGVLVEKLPFLLLALLLTALTVWVHPGFESQGAYPLKGRIFIAVHSLISYLGKITLPLNLAPIYPTPSIADIFSFEYIRPFIGLTAIIILCIRLSKRSTVFSAIWLYYTATLMPVLGQVGAQPGADRYTYLPSIGLFLLSGLGMGYLFERCSKKQQAVLAAALIFMFGTLISKTITQVAVWKDSMTLWSYEIKHFPDTAYIAYNNRGIVYDSMGNYQHALMDFNKVIKINPGYAEAYRNRGLIFSKLHNFHQALKDINKAIELNKNKPAIAYNSRGSIYVNSGDYHRAIEDFNMAIKLDSRFAEAYYNRGTTYRILKDNYQAINDFSMTIKLNPQYAEAYNNRGNAYGDLGNYQQAIEDYSMAIKLNPKDAIAYRNRGVAYKNLGYNGRALKDFNKEEE